MGWPGFFKRLRFLHRLGLGRRLPFLRFRCFRFAFFRFFIRDGGFGRILQCKGGLDRGRRFGNLWRFCRRGGELRGGRLEFALGRQRGLDLGWRAPSPAPAASVA